MPLTIKNLKFLNNEAPIDFEIKENGLYGLIGKNGIGKSTLYSVISGEIAIKQGQVITGQVVYFPSVENFDENLNGWNYLRLLDDHHFEYAKKLAENIGADSYLSKKIGKYSFGMKQLFAAILSFSTPSEILLIDELFNGLDVLVKSKVIYELRKISHEKIILYTSHNLKEIEQCCDQSFILTTRGIEEVSDFEAAAQEIGFGLIPMIE
ncbi:MAG: ATP-binding cassette domain-containing protein [Streptococcaceae bacterium]|jgi:ABC-2 type transport system ATP-binding protein|nr:ATP-binding cassette domain-containing protein [Streptococcaceae bacterium]